MNKKCYFIREIISILLVLNFITITLSGCGNRQHLEMAYEENDNANLVGWDDIENDNVVDWDNVSIASWSDVDEFSEWIYAQILFDDITDEYPLIECQVLDYKTNGKYFDGDKVYTLIGEKFDLNALLTKYAIGTGVIVICVVMNVATAGGSTPICCFIAGAAEGTVSYAIKGAAFGAAINAVDTAIKSGGDFEETLYGALEGSADGYMWGAIYGAISGGLNSSYCFLGETLVLTEKGDLPIKDIAVGDMVYAYDEIVDAYAFKPVTQVNISNATSIVKVCVKGEIIESTLAHPYYTDVGWKQASELKNGDLLLASNKQYYPVQNIEIVDYDNPLTVYTLCVQDFHSFMVGSIGFVVHNRCNINSEYAGKTKYIEDDPELAAKYPNGVPYTEDAFPVFDEYAINKVKFPEVSKETLEAGTCLTGNCKKDFILANKQAGYTETPSGYTWHHHEDKCSLLLVPTELHMKMRHTGGASLIKAKILELLGGSAGGI